MSPLPDIKENHLNALFPFHFVLDNQLKIIRTGDSLNKLMPDIAGLEFEDKFRFIRPSVGIKVDFHSILRYLNQIFILQCDMNPPLMLRGQFTLIEGYLFFTGSPWLLEVDDLERFNLLISDFAIHDPVTDMLQVLKVRQMSLDDLQKQRDELIRKNKEISDLARFPSENPNPVMRISLSRTIRYANKASQALLENFNCSMGELCPDEMCGAFVDVIRENEQVEKELAVGDNTYVLQFTPFLDDGYINVYGRDISRQKIAERVLLEREEHFKQLVEDASDLIYRIDVQGFFTYTNPIAERIMKFTPQEFTKRHFTDLIREDWRKKAVEFYKKQFDENIPYTYFEFPAIDNEGKELWIGQNVKSLEENGKIIGFQAVARDITDRKRMEESLSREKKKAEELLLIREQFLANMSHEIRTPMSGILGMSKLLSTAPLSPKHEKYLAAIQSSARNLLVIINDILDLSKMESGKLELEIIGFNLGSLITHCMESMEYLTADKDLMLIPEFDRALNNQILKGDPVRMNQVLTNLIGNAIKFTDRGEVRVMAEIMREDEKAMTLRIAVSDTGIGIPESKLATIFDSFRQVDTSTTRRFGGTGLGLSICKLIMDLAGGKIWVKSKPGNGSTFYLEIEFEKGTQEDIPDDRLMEETTYDLEDVRVLLVEDHTVNQVFATSILEDKGCIVKLVENGEDAVNELKKHDYDVVLMDMQMPVMDGVEATQIIREELRLSVPIIALTANALKGQDEKYLQLGMNRYISKPFKDTELIHTIGRLLGLVPVKLQRDHEPAINPSAEHPEVEEPVFNLKKLKDMASGDAKFVKRMLQIFIDDIPKSLDLMKKSLKENDYDQVGAVAHKMKPSASLMGMESLRDLLQYIEDHAYARTNLVQVSKKVSTVVSTCELALEQLKGIAKK